MLKKDVPGSDKEKEKWRLRSRKNWSLIKNNPLRMEKYRERRKRFLLNRRITVLSFYSKGVPKCACCGEMNYEFLAIDHINNDGNKHRKQIGGNINAWIMANNFPDMFQVLCHNCNFAKGVYKICPHKR